MLPELLQSLPFSQMTAFAGVAVFQMMCKKMRLHGGFCFTSQKNIMNEQCVKRRRAPPFLATPLGAKHCYNVL